MNRKRIVVLCLFLVCAGAALANTPNSKVVIEVKDPGPMPAGALAATAVVTNGYDEAVTVEFPPYSVVDLDLKVTPSQLHLQPGQSAEVEVTGIATAERKFAVFLEAPVTNGEGTLYVAAVLPFHLDVYGEGRAGLIAQLGSYDALFVETERFRLPGIGWVYLPGRGVPRPTAPSPDDPVEPQPEPEDGESTPPPAAGISTTSTTGFEPDEGIIGDGVLEEYSLAAAQARPRRVGENTDTTIKGVFRWVDTKGAVRKAWGWRVALLADTTIGWINTGKWTTVATDGTWSMKVGLFDDKAYRVMVYPSNDYFTIANMSGTMYRVVLPVFYGGWWDTIDYKSHYVDLQKGVAAGLGELHFNAYDLYTKLVAAGYTPIRSKPIVIEFPSTNECGACSLNYKVVMPADKGADSHTIRHELGHELMVEKWEKMPAGSGGFHIWPNCATKGLALAEGFAHFVSWWSTVDRNTATGTWGTGWNGETPSDKICKGIETNELRVAATFWDLHDKKVDGDDDYSYGNAGRIFRMILDGGVKNTMTELLPRLEDAGGFEWWKIEPILEMNFTN